MRPSTARAGRPCETALRAFLAVLISAVLFSLGGWPFASLGVALVGVTIALSANTPNPGAFAAAAVIAMPIAALLAGVTEFLILDGVDQFPLLAIGMAPSVLAAALLFTTSQSETGLDRVPGSRLLSRDALPDEPAELQPRDLSVLQLSGDHVGHPAVRPAADLLPASDALRRRWYLTSARAEMRELLAGRRSRRLR